MSRITSSELDPFFIALSNMLVNSAFRFLPNLSNPVSFNSDIIDVGS